MTITNQPNFDEEFEQAVAGWRERHKLSEDDAVLMLVELFRIHQRHWDEVRRRELPSFEQFRSDIAILVETTRAFQVKSAELIEMIGKTTSIRPVERIPRSAAFFAALASLMAGYMIGRLWS